LSLLSRTRQPGHRGRDPRAPSPCEVVQTPPPSRRYALIPPARGAQTHRRNVRCARCPERFDRRSS